MITVQSDEIGLINDEPTAADWAEYAAWLESQEASLPLPE